MSQVDNIVGCILCEETNTNVEFKIKDENKNGFIIAEGILQQGDEVNRNRRYYPTEELAKAVNSPRQQELISTGNFKGEAGHPTDTSLGRQAKIDPTLEQVWYTKLWMDGDYVMGQFRGTNNELGRSFNADLKDGQRPSFSLRAVGSLVNENGKMTVRNMQMITYDRVYFPSHSKAYMTKIITTESAIGLADTSVKKYDIDENNYFYIKSSEINSLSESGNDVAGLEDLVLPLTQQQINSFLVSESTNIKSALNTFDSLYESMTIAPDLNTVTMKTSIGDTIMLDLETAVKKEIINSIDSYF